MAAGNRLGQAGSRIVGEVLVGLLDLDPGSVRHAELVVAPLARRSATGRWSGTNGSWRERRRLPSVASGGSARHGS